MESQNQGGSPILCPGDSVWTEVAAGLGPEEYRERLVAHAAQCGPCAGLLASAVRTLSAEATAEENSMIEALQSAKPEWQEDMARSLVAMAAPPRGRAWGWRMVGLAAAAAVLIGSPVWYFRQRNAPPLQLLARAYTVRRVLELRVPGAAYAKLAPIEQGPRGSASNRPAELSDSESIIRRHLDSYPADAPWLLAQGRADLLERNYPAAIEGLERALLLVPAAPSTLREDILVDLANAHFGRFETGDSSTDLSASLENLGKAIQSNPNLAVAYFNRAIVSEKLFLFEPARRDWQRYLQLDPRGAWAEEARWRLAILEQRLHSAMPGTAGLRYLPEVALVDAMTGALGAPARAELAATLLKHGDRWLSDSEQQGSPDVRIALQGIARNRGAMQIEEFPVELKTLAAISARALAPPDRAWVEFERLYRVAHVGSVATCAKSLDELEALLRQRGYVWLQAQATLERSSCEMAAGTLAASLDTVREAIGIAAKHAFPVAEFRANGYLCNWMAQAGQYREAASVAREQLAKFWSHPYPLERSQEFYNDLCWVFEGLGHWHAAAAAAQMAASIAHRVGWVPTEAVNRARWASFAERAGLRDEAAEQYALAEKLFQSVKETPSVAQYRAFAESANAELRGDLSGMTRWRDIIRQSTTPIVAVPYLRVMADFEARLGNLDAAEGDLRDAIARVRGDAGNSPRNVQDRRWRMELDRSYRSLVAVDLAQSKVANALQDWQEFIAADTRLQSFDSEPFPASPEGDAAVMLTFARLDDRYGVWIRHNAEPRFVWIPGSASELDLLVQRYLSLCSQPAHVESAAARSLEKELGKRLLDPTVDSSEPETALLIQTDGELARLPWAALPLKSGGLLGDRFLIAADPMATQTSGAIHFPVVPVHRGLIVAATVVDPRLAADFPPLPDVDREVTAVRDSLPESAVISGIDATVRRIEERWSQGDVFHFVGHAALAGGTVRLLVAPDPDSHEAGTAQGMWQPRLQASPKFALVVLSACSTARYEEAESTQPMHLAAGFLLAGTRQVLATLWNTDSAATRRLMSVFYRNLRQGGSAASALRNARREVRTTPGWEDPYYWAPFVLFLRV